MIKGKKMTCIHCQDDIKIWPCVICQKDIEAECKLCHNELKHNIIKNQNLHICGSPTSKVNEPDDDTDAYGQSWKVDN